MLSRVTQVRRAAGCRCARIGHEVSIRLCPGIRRGTRTHQGTGVSHGTGRGTSIRAAPDGAKHRSHRSAVLRPTALAARRAPARGGHTHTSRDRNPGAGLRRGRLAICPAAVPASRPTVPAHNLGGVHLGRDARADASGDTSRIPVIARACPVRLSPRLVKVTTGGVGTAHACLAREGASRCELMAVEQGREYLRLMGIHP